MFPASFLMHLPRAQRRCGHPCDFERFPTQFEPQRCGSGPSPYNPFIMSEDMQEALVPFMNILNKLGDQCSEKEEIKSKSMREKSEGRKSCPHENDLSMKNENEKSCKPRKSTVFNEILDDAFTSFENLEARNEKKPKKWHEELDFKGFNVRNISVKINAGLLYVKANKREETEFGISTSSIRKTVPLPENIDASKISVKLSSTGSLVIEAPYLDECKIRAVKQDLVKNVIKTILPGLENLLTSHFGFEGVKKPTSNDKEVKKSTRKDENVTNSSGCDDTNVKQKADDDKLDERNEESNEKLTKTIEQAVEKRKIEKDEGDFKEDKESKTLILDKIEKFGEIIGNQTYSEKQFGDGKETSCDLENYDKGEHNSIQGPNWQNGNNKTQEPIIVFPEEREENEIGDDFGKNDDISVHSDESFELLTEYEKEKNTETTLKTNEDKDDEIFPTEEDVIIDKEEEEELDFTVNENPASCPELTETREHHFQEEVNQTDAFKYQIEMPSFNPESIKVSFDDIERLVTISARKDINSVKSSNSITKTMVVPEDVDVNGLNCTFRDGTLTLRAPSKVSVRSIPVNI